jgi:hypothetical protein
MKEALIPKHIENSEKRLDLDNIMQNTEFFVAEGETLTKAKELVANEYANFMPSDRRDPLLAYHDLCSEELNPESSTLVAVYKNPENPENTSILGTIRLTFGDPNRTPPLEAMDLVDVVDKETGKSRWPHEDMNENIDISEISELGRLVFSKEVREDLKSQFFVAKALMQEITNLAKENNAKLMIAILPYYVYAFASRNNINLTPLNSNREIVLKDSPRAKEIRDRYSNYWENLNPSLYTVDYK